MTNGHPEHTRDWGANLPNTSQDGWMLECEILWQLEVIRALLERLVELNEGNNQNGG